MGANATFDSDTRIITITKAPDANGIVTIDVVVDLYSDGKEDWETDSVLNRNRFPFFSSGNEPTGDSNAPTYIFLRNDQGWRIRPFEADHELRFNGNLVGVDPTFPVFVPTLGAFTVFSDRISNQVPNDTSQKTKVDEVYTRLGLQKGNPITDTTGGITDNNANIDIVRSGDGETTSTLTRQ